MKQPPKHLLVLRFSALGDVAMVLPVLYSMAEAYPTTQFTLVTQPVASKLYLALPPNVTVRKIETKGAHAGIKGILKLYKELRGEGFDAVADLHDVLRTRLLRTLFRLAGKRVATIDKGRSEKRALTSPHKHSIAPLKSTINRYFDVFAALGMTASPTFQSIFEGGKADSSLIASLSPAKHEVWIGVAPFAKHKGKIYPIEKMKQVVARFAQDERYKVFLFGGGAEEEAILHSWTVSYPRAVSLVAARPGFAVELALISQLDVMLSMDSANMHLASMVGTPVVSIWGATHYYAGFLGWKQQPENIVEVALPCRPCSVFGDKPCHRGDYACMERIEPQTIIAKVEQLVAPALPVTPQE